MLDVRGVRRYTRIQSSQHPGFCGTPRPGTKNILHPQSVSDGCCFLKNPVAASYQPTLPEWSLIPIGQKADLQLAKRTATVPLGALSDHFTSDTTGHQPSSGQRSPGVGCIGSIQPKSSP